MTLSFDVITLVICWGLFAVTWGVGWVYNVFKGPKKQSGSVRGYYQSVIAAAMIMVLYGFIRLFTTYFTLPVSLWLQIAGGICLVVSTGFALWARLILGVMWSGKPETKVGHQLRTNGPYGITRHPIYTGIFGMLIGSVFLSGVNIFWLLSAVVIITGLSFRIPVEEKLMVEMFGEQYHIYQREVSQIIPGIQWPSFNKPTRKGQSK